MQNLDLLVSSYDFELPSELVAQRPVEPRDQSRLMVYHLKTGHVGHHYFYELPDLIPQNSHLVFNQSKVFPCRLSGIKETGGKFEIFFLTVTPKPYYQVLIRSNRTKKVGDEFTIDSLKIRVETNNEDGTFGVSVNMTEAEFLHYLDANAKIPIPPYIRQGDSDERDKCDYQTLYAKPLGSVAAPTAGLHFTQNLFSHLEQKNIQKSFVTLHVGMGTFKPVATENILEHKMHEEIFEVDAETLKNLNQHQKKLIAVGTTSLRVLETLYSEVGFTGNKNSTDIFLHPGVKVKSVSGLLTNFHLPKSSLLILLSSLIGREKTLELYHLAIEKKYRFYSYGDAMLVLR